MGHSTHGFFAQMPIITLTNISKSYGPQTLFADATFLISERERVALIGANGSGKTTLLRIICGEETADSGTLAKEPGITVGYLPQEVDLPETAGLHLAVTGVTPELLACATELAELERRIAHSDGDQALGSRYAELTHHFDTLRGFDYEVQAKAILLGLGFDESEFAKPMNTLSGGQKTRAALARLLLLSPDLLLLDEPTNHLDIQACEWLQSFLKDRFQGAALIVSHDRYFLDQVVGKVVEIEDRNVYTYPGNYHAFAHQKAERIEEQRRFYKLQQKEIKRIEEAIQTLFSDRKFSRRDNKIKQLERVERINRPRDQQGIKVTLIAAEQSGQEVIQMIGLAKSYPGKDLFKGLDFTVERGRKIGVVGPNGSGKTTLLKILAGRERADSGRASFGYKVEPVYFAQEFDHLVPDRTAVEELLADADLTSKEARDLFAQFLFFGDTSFKRVEVLSGGEQCRLALAKVLADQPNLLLLDEPTNHLDIRSREALEDALRAYNGTMLVASHDRYLLDAITDGIIEIKDGSWAYYLGNYSEYREKTMPPPPPPPAPVSRKKAKAAPAPIRRAPDSPLRQKEKLLRELEKRRKELEHGIEQTEVRVQQLTAELGNEENYRNGSARELSREYEELTPKLHELYAEWERVCEEISKTEEG